MPTSTERRGFSAVSLHGMGSFSLVHWVIVLLMLGLFGGVPIGVAIWAVTRKRPNPPEEQPRRFP